MAITVDLLGRGPRKPDWLRVSLPIGDEYERVKAKVNALALHTVCKEAACPNVAECWGAGTATIMILGDTLHARLPLLQREDRQSRAAKSIGSNRYASPKRCGISAGNIWSSRRSTATISPDGGALIFANTVREIHERVPGARVEILSGDYRGDLPRWTS